MTKTRSKLLGSGMLAVMVAVSLAGCGGADGGGMTGNADAGRPAAGGVSLTWKDNGKAYMALIGSAARVKSATTDMLQVSGGDSSGAGIAFGVVVNAPPLAAGTYTYAGGAGYPIISISYTPGTGKGQSAVPSALAIGLTTLGDVSGTRAVGTFSATLPLDNGTTATLTDGNFDLPLTVNSL